MDNLIQNTHTSTNTESNMVGSNFFRCNEEATDSSSIISTTPKKIQKQAENNFVRANVEEEAGDLSV